MQKLSPLEITKQLIKFNTENHIADTREISNFIADILEENSLKCKFIKNKNQIYLVSEVGHGGNKLTLYGHSDVVAAGNYEKWTYHPYKPVVKDGKLYGRGSSDMKGGIGAAISAFVELSQYQTQLTGTLQLLICPDEEDFDENRLLPKIIRQLKSTGCIMGEPHFDDIMIGEKGEVELQIRAFGKSSHGSTPGAGVDANILLDNFIHDLKAEISEFNKRLVTQSSAINKLLKNSNMSISNQFNLSGAAQRNFIQSNPTGTITINVGYYKAGHSYNAVPDEAEAHLVMMVPYGFDQANISNALKKLAGKYKNQVLPKILWANNASLTSPNAQIVKSMEKAYYAVKHKKPKLVFDTGPTDATFYRWQNIPAVLYGPGYFYNAHTYNEYVSVKELDYSKEIYKKAALDFLS